MNDEEFGAALIYVGHITEAIDRIQSYVAELTEREFMASLMTQDAVIRNLLVIGEASNNLKKNCPRVMTGHPEIPINALRGMRNILLHGYFDLTLVWRAVKAELPGLQRQIDDLSRTASRGYKTEFDGTGGLA